MMDDDDLRWTWFDNLAGGPAEDELAEPLRTLTYRIPSHIDPEALKAKLRAKALTNPKPEHWARRLGRRITGVWSKQ